MTMTDWRVYAAKYDVKTDMMLIRGERVVSRDEWQVLHKTMRRRFGVEQEVYDNIKCDEDELDDDDES